MVMRQDSNEKISKVVRAVELPVGRMLGHVYIGM